MSKLSKVALVVGIILGVLLIFILIGIIYSLYEIGAPPKFKVLGISIVDDDGYPSLLVRFETNKYTLLKFKLFNEYGELIESVSPTEGSSAVALSLVGLSPYTNIIGSHNYTLMIYYGDELLYEEQVSVHGINPIVSLVSVGVNETIFGYEVNYLVLDIRNDGDVPLYVTTLNTSIYINNESVASSIRGNIVTILPGEEKEVVIDLVPYITENPVINIEILFEGQGGYVQRSLTVNLENYT